MMRRKKTKSAPASEPVPALEGKKRRVELSNNGSDSGKTYKKGKRWFEESQECEKLEINLIILLMPSMNKIAHMYNMCNENVCSHK